MKIWVLIVIAFLALATIIVWTFATAALYSRGQCRTYPYYWCDTKWQCCGTANNNENCPAAGGSGLGGSYNITDKFYGTNTDSNLGDDDHNLYYHLCIAPSNSIIASNPGTSLACLYSPGPNGPISCNGYLPSSIPNIDPTLPPYNNGQYVASDCNLPTPGLGCYGLQGRCKYANIDDPVDPDGTTTTPYLPLYPDSNNTQGQGYYQNPQIGDPNIKPYKSGYYFAGNSSPGTIANNGWNNGPNQANSQPYSAWNRLGNPLAPPP